MITCVSVYFKRTAFFGIRVLNGRFGTARRGVAEQRNYGGAKGGGRSIGEDGGGAYGMDLIVRLMETLREAAPTLIIA